MCSLICQQLGGVGAVTFLVKMGKWGRREDNKCLIKVDRSGWNHTFKRLLWFVGLTVKYPVHRVVLGTARGNVYKRA